jgi:energy-coupling factor transporter ATP-binding protein EcfA2
LRVPEVACEDLVHVYRGGVRALDGITLSIRAGERVALIGQNGSGKSTLVRHLNGLLRPTSGRVLLDGADVRRERVAQLARRVGLTFQDPDRQIFAGSVRDEIRFGPRNVGLRGGALREAVREALALTGLEDYEDRNPYELGNSRRKLLALASVLAMRTPIVVLDEPTTGQDAAGVAIVGSVIDRLAADGRTVIAVTHDMELAAERFDRVIVLGSGRVLLDGPPSEAFHPHARDVLRSTNLEPPLAARVAASLGIASAVTNAQLVAELARSGARQ